MLAAELDGRFGAGVTDLLLPVELQGVGVQHSEGI